MMRTAGLVFCLAMALGLRSADESNLSTDTKEALGADWQTAAAVPHMLKALQAMTIPEGGTITGTHPEKALCELIAADPRHESLYRTAVGLPGYLCGLHSAVPRPVGGLSDFLDLLAKTTTVEKKKLEDQISLARSVEKLIGDLYRDDALKPRLSEVHSAFAAHSTYVGLYLLLAMVPNDTSEYLLNLARLRAAFALDSDKLAALVAAKIPGQ